MFSFDISTHMLTIWIFINGETDKMNSIPMILSTCLSIKSEIFALFEIPCMCLHAFAPYCEKQMEFEWYAFVDKIDSHIFGCTVCVYHKIDICAFKSNSANGMEIDCRMHHGCRVCPFFLIVVK